MASLAEAIDEAKARLAAVGDSPRQDAEILLGQLLGLSRAQLFARLSEPLPDKLGRAYAERIARRARGVPVAYLTGEKGFWSLTLKVTPAVLVPRPETELLVEWALELLPPRGARVADLGTGSGAIALALATELPQAQVIATDLEAEALAVARENARTLGLRNVEFRQGHWFEPVAGGRFDLILANPPYIAARDPHLEQLSAEPLVALTDGGDGLNALREIVGAAAAHLRPGGALLVEHGHDQGAAVRELFARAGFRGVETRRDLGGLERATGARRD